MLRRTLPWLAVAFGLVSTVSVAAPIPKTTDNPHVSLKDHINVKHDENLHSENYPDNNLKSLPTGKQKLGEVTFDIGAGVLQLGSASVTGKPEKIEGIKVGRTATHLHFLQGCGYSAEKDQVIGKYIIRCDDPKKTTEEVDIVFGVDVVDWWAYPDRDAPVSGKVAWEGENEASKGFKAKIRLYHTTWKNPHPDKKIATIDFVTTDPTKLAAAPFCVAITCDGK